MSPVRFIKSALPVLDETISTSTPVNSKAFFLGAMFSAQASWIISVGSGLTATFQVMISQDGETWYNSGQTLPAAAGSATTFPVQYSGSFPWVCVQVTQSAGSGTVLINGNAVGGA